MLLKGPHGNIEYGHLIRNSIFLLSWNFSLPGMNFKGARRRKQAAGVCVLMLWVRVVVKWSHSPRCSLTLNF